MRRRRFIAALGAALAAPPAAPQVRRASRLVVAIPAGPIERMMDRPEGAPTWRTFFAELRQLGWREGENLVVERRSGGGRADAYGELAREVVALGPDVIYATSAQLVQRLKSATATIPIVASTADPVSYGFASSLSRPGGNITGVSSDAGLELWAKHLEVLSSVVPGLQRFGFIAPHAAWEQPQARAVKELAAGMSLQVVPGLLINSIDAEAYQRVFRELAVQRVEALLLGDHAEHLAFVSPIVELAAAHKLPTSYPYREFVDKGGLVAYGIRICKNIIASPLELWIGFSEARSRAKSRSTNQPLSSSSSI